MDLRAHTNKQEDEMEIGKIMKGVENFNNSHMTYGTNAKILKIGRLFPFFFEETEAVSFDGKPFKNQRLPGTPNDEETKAERGKKMLQEEDLGERLVVATAVRNQLENTNLKPGI
ncbi:hypothetical protein L195_g028894 [Trifolium pratense]|uniref:Uncharacterized protein n=1 Tax=Trifolium pratense TaxID=57577 RepID=A0A2K3L3A7_TRIPR|nr:hypothetical protein L195_g028894 [Trifolium pratense]